MTAAVILCGDQPAGPLSGESPAIVDRLCRQLSDLGVTEFVLLARPASAQRLRAAGLPARDSADAAADLGIIRDLAAQGTRSLVLCEGDLMAHTDALAEAVADGIRQTTALVGPRRRLDLHPLVLRQRGRIISIGSAYHQASHANCALRGLVKVSVEDLGALDRACEQLTELTAVTGQPLEALAGTGGLVGLVVLALTRGGTPVAGYRVRIFTAGRVADPETLESTRRQLSSLDESAVALRLAVKEHDDLFATYCVSSYSPRLVRLAARLGLTPTAVTWISILFVVLASAGYAVGRREFAIAGGLLLYVGFVFDCVDGQLARYTHRYSRFGGWLDVIADRSKEYLIYAALAVGAARSGDDVWILAVGAMVLQTVRHMTDTWYGALQDEALSWLPRLPLARRGDRLGQDTETNLTRLSTRLGRRLGRASARLESDRASPGYWAKRTVVFPIGERWLVIIVATPLFGARIALIALLSWGAAALVYTLTGRTLRARAMRLAPLPPRGTTLHRDDGLLARLLGRLGRGRPSPLGTALIGLVVVAGLAVTATPGLPDTLDLTDDRLLLAGAASVLLAATAQRHAHAGALDWLVPAILRAAEASFVVLVGINEHVPAALILSLLGVIALYHYDLAARLDKGASPLRVRALDLGWDGRITVLAAAGALGVGTEVVSGTLGWLVLAFVCSALAGLARPLPTARPEPAHAAGSAVALAAPAPASGPPGSLQVPAQRPGTTDHPPVAPPPVRT